MEGFGVATRRGARGRAGARGARGLEPVGERDRSRWQVDDALEALRAALPRVLEVVAHA